jgi:hypothetical protein
MKLISSLDTTTENELFFDSVCTMLLIVTDAQGIETFSIEDAALARLKDQFARTLDRIRRRRGPEKQLSLWWLVWELCDLWARATRRPVTNSAVRGGDYTSRPESPAGKFVLAIVKLMQPSESWISQNLRPESAIRARKHAASAADLARTVSFAMRDYVASHRPPGARRGRPPSVQ